MSKDINIDLGRSSCSDPIDEIFDLKNELHEIFNHIYTRINSIESEIKSLKELECKIEKLEGSKK